MFPFLSATALLIFCLSLKSLLCLFILFRTAFLSSIPSLGFFHPYSQKSIESPQPVVWYQSTFPRVGGREFALSNGWGQWAKSGTARSRNTGVARSKPSLASWRFMLLLFPHLLSGCLLCMPKYRFSTQVLKLCSQSFRSY